MVVSVPGAEDVSGDGVTVKEYVVVALYLVLMEVRVVVHLILDVAVTVVVTVEQGRREEQALDRMPGEKADRAVGFGFAGWFAGVARGPLLLMMGAERAMKWNTQ